MFDDGCLARFVALFGKSYPDNRMITNPSVVAIASKFQSRIEGVCAWMYLDVKGLVTTAIGLLIDPYGPAVTSLPWTDRYGAPVKPSQVEAEWNKVKGLQWMAKRGGLCFANVTDLRLSQSAIDDVTTRKMVQNEAILLKYFPNFGQFPPDAQLGIHSMAWACGAAFPPIFPHFTAAANQNDLSGWMACAGQLGDASAHPELRGHAWMNDTGNTGLRPRNLANRACFINAATVAGGHTPADVLYYGTEQSAPSI